MALSLLLCFTGFRMVRKWISLISFVAGAFFGYSAASAAGLQETYWFLPLLIAIGAGIFVSLVGYRLFQVGLFVFCGAVSSWAVTAHVLPPVLSGVHGSAGYYIQIVLQAAVFLIGGIMAVKFTRTAIILISSIGGARIASSGLAALVPLYFPDTGRTLAVFAGLALCGIVFQFLTTRKN